MMEWTDLLKQRESTKSQECEGSYLTFHACNFCIAYNLISTMNHYSKSEDKNTGVINIINSNTTKCLVT